MRRIVLLIGPSSVGKTTLCHELENKHKWNVINQDDLRDALDSDSAQEKNRNEDMFKKSVQEEIQRQNLFSELTQYMTEEEVLKLCLSGELVLTVGKHRNANDTRVVKHKFENPNFETIDELKKKLYKAGFDQQEVNFLAVRLRLVGRVMYQIPDKVFNKAMEHALKSSTSSIVDAIPPDGGVGVINRYVKKQVDNYLKDHPKEDIQIFTVLAYCSPQDLSQRVKNRNENAVLSNDLTDLREGTGPFTHLGSVVNASKVGDPEDKKIGEVSKDDLVKIAYDHPKRVNIHLVSAVPEKIKEGEYYLVKNIDQNTWSLHYQKKSQVHVLSSNEFQNRDELKDLNLIMSEFDKVLSGRKPEDLPFDEFVKNVAAIRKTILNFHTDSKGSKFGFVAVAAMESASLAKQFGMPKTTDSSQKVGLFARAKEFDFMMDTASGNPTPALLAETFFEEMAKIENKRDAKNAPRKDMNLK